MRDPDHQRPDPRLTSAELRDADRPALVKQLQYVVSDDYPDGIDGRIHEYTRIMTALDRLRADDAETAR